MTDQDLIDSPQLRSKIEATIDARLPRLSKVERLLRHWYGVVAVFVAVPFATGGLQAAANKLFGDTVQHVVDEALRKEDGPVRQAMKSFTAFSGKLSDEFAQSVDSASSKFLRFGCNQPATTTPAPGFPACVAAAVNDRAALARDVQEVQDQTIVFKANANQRVLLKLRLHAIDGIDVLRHVGLRLQTPPLLATSDTGEYDLRLPQDALPDTQDFVDQDSGMMRLVGAVADRGEREPLHVDLDITGFLRKKSDLHALRIRSRPLKGTPANGAERFYLHAIVVVTHSLPK